MAIDFLIFGLLLISFTINLLALGAFWVTPGLRTTANRFTINLLIINLIGCLILAPTLFLSDTALWRPDPASDSAAAPGADPSRPSYGFASASAAVADDDTIEFYSKPGNHQMTIRHNGQLVEREGVILRRNASHAPSERDDSRTIETIFKCNQTFCQELTIDEGSDTIVITEIEEEHEAPPAPGAASKEPSEEGDEDADEDDDEDEVESPLVAPAPVPVALRCWSIDMAAALGALAVLLVVGDTWCAVTDPLRYHSRISGVKAWVLIALTWALGVFFGALSAFRELDFESQSVFTTTATTTTTTTSSAGRRQTTSAESLQHSAASNAANAAKAEAGTLDFGTVYSSTTTWSASSNIFGMVYAGVYFVVIILLPFGFVCGMYWRIFSEARENGLRMRQNGSSPLLQSALNLTGGHHQQHQQQQQPQPQPYANSLCVHRNSLTSVSSQGAGGLQMSIDLQRKGSPGCLRRDSAAKVLLPTISDDGGSDDVDVEHEHDHEHDPDLDVDVDLDVDADHLMTVMEQQQQQQQQSALPDRNANNILLTLQTASGEIKRNYSARQLPLLGASSQDFHETRRAHGLRQVHSSPDLHKSAQLRQDDASSPKMLGGGAGAAGASPLTTRPHSHPPLYRSHQSQTQHQGHHHHHHHHHQGHHHSHVLQIPAIHASPKALSYMSSLRHRLSNASSLFKYREESRAARISILVVIMFLVSYLPYGVLVLLQAHLGAANFAHSTQLAIFMLLLGNLSSPFIFAYRNKRVRRGVKRLFGLDARSRDRHLQRQSSSSGRGSGFLHRHSSSTNGNGNGSGSAFKSAVSIRRTGSKVSTYSANSCKYLTPQSSLVSNGNGAHPGSGSASLPVLRPNNSCSTIVNFGTVNNNNNNNNNGAEVQQANGKGSHSHGLNNNNSYLIANIEGAATRCGRPLLQRGITIVEQIPLPGPEKAGERRSIFQMLCHGSRGLTQSCGHEPSQV